MRNGYDPFPEIRLPQKSQKGDAAIQALGANLTKVAKHYKLSDSNFKSWIRNDRQTRVSDRGLVFYEEPVPASLGDGTISNNPAAAEISESLTFRLHSRPGARAILYLNHQGQTVNNGYWSSSTINAAPYSRDGDPSFNSQELQDVRDHWLRVSEDYAQFNVDVTTERPSSVDGTHFIEIVVTPTWEWYGQAGGVCYLNSFSWGGGVGNQVCWVFSSLLGNGQKYVAEAISHEAGHSLSLRHWQQFNGDGSVASGYYSGNGTWAPIMGVGYYVPVVTWSKGEYPGAGTYNLGTYQDDVAAIGSMVGSSVTDEAAGTLSSNASLGSAGSDGVVRMDYRGVISSSADVDVFRMDTSGGDLSFTVNPSRVDANLDFRVRVYNGSKALVYEANAPGLSSTPVSLGAMPAGTYWVEIAPQGSGDPYSGGYSIYGSSGQYQVVGSYNSGGTVNPTPTPQPSATPQPTATPWPTATPQPSATPVPPSPPQVSVTSPIHGGTIQYRSNATITASATDNSRVKRVRILVDGSQVCNKTFSAPSVTVSCGYSVRAMVGSYLTITAEATDDAGTKTTSSSVRVTVVR